MNRLLIFTDAGLDDAIALQYIFTHNKIPDMVATNQLIIDIRCVSGNVGAKQVYDNVLRVINTTPIADYENLYVSCQPASYDDAIEPWVEGYGEDGVLGLYQDIEPAKINRPTPEIVEDESIYILVFSPFTLANKMLHTYFRQIIAIVAMGGHDSSYEGEDMEFNQSLDNDSFQEFVRDCDKLGVPFKLVTYEDCVKYDSLLIDVPEDIRGFYSKYQFWCDSYTSKMKELDMHTTCYDLVAAISLCKDM